MSYGRCKTAKDKGHNKPTHGRMRSEAHAARPKQPRPPQLRLVAPVKRRRGEVKFDRAPIHGGLGGRSPKLRGLGERVAKLSHHLVPQGWSAARQDLELLSLQGD